MSQNYRTLDHYTIAHGALLNRRRASRPDQVTMADPALLVMTDLSENQAFTIDETATIDSANIKMISCGIRLLFVTESSSQIVGLITASDILGERPMQYLAEHSGRREDILVKDIMTPKIHLDVFRLADLANARIGEVVESMAQLGRQHMLVVETDENGQESIRGMYSTTQIERQLGMSIALSNRANTFAELGKAIAGS